LFAGRYGIVDGFWTRSEIKAAMKKAEVQNRIGQFNDAFGFCGVIFCV
jgi:hypothetical protein